MQRQRRERTPAGHRAPRGIQEPHRGRKTAEGHRRRGKCTAPELCGPQAHANIHLAGDNTSRNSGNHGGRHERIVGEDVKECVPVKDFVRRGPQQEPGDDGHGQPEQHPHRVPPSALIICALIPMA